MKYIVLPSNESKDIEAIGGKAYGLARLSSVNVPIPPWFVLTVDAFFDSLSQQQSVVLSHSENINEIKEAMSELMPSEAVRNEVQQALLALCKNGEPVAVRSSAADEDGLQQSFAGMLDSYLLVMPEDVIESIVKIWQSAFSERVFAYRRENKIDQLVHPPAILIQQMVFPDVSGVAFSADPITMDRQVAVVSSIWGLGELLVSGECDADSFHINAAGVVIKENIANKAKARMVHLQNDQYHLLTIDMPAAQSSVPSLTHQQAHIISQLARKCEAVMGEPQDIEFAIAKGRLHLLQSRPISTLTERAQPAGQYETQLDHSLILDDWCGVTLPLTYSVIRQYYAGMYRKFNSIADHSPSNLARLEYLLEQIMAYVQGRIYVNKNALANLWEMVPDYAFFHRSLEILLGVGGAPQVPGGKLQMIKSMLVRWRVLGCFWRIHQRVPANIQVFHMHVQQLLGAESYVPEKKSIPQLAENYHEIIGLIKNHWDAPTFNDYLSNILYTVLSRFLKETEIENPDALLSQLLAADKNTMSYQAASEISALADMVSKNEMLYAEFNRDPHKTILNSQRSFPEFYKKYQAYLDKFSDRCIEDLKFESPSLKMSPQPLIENILTLAIAKKESGAGAKKQIDLISQRQHAEGKARKSINRSFLKKALFFVLLRATRKLVWNREQMRFEFTRLFGRMRIIFLELGARLQKLGVLENAEHIYYLYVDEVLDYLYGRNVGRDLKSIVDSRRSAFELHNKQQPPDHQIIMKGLISLEKYSVPTPVEVEESPDSLRGVSASAGIAVGPVRFVDDLRNHQLKSGDILIAQNSDPGFVAVFPIIAGALFEQGSPLSHTAIVARELGVPVLVSVKGLRERFADGDMVELNGETGLIRKVAAPAT